MVSVVGQAVQGGVGIWGDVLKKVNISSDKLITVLISNGPFPFVILWMSLIFWCSTGIFSDAHTIILVKKILPFLFPAISPETSRMIHLFLRKAAHVTEYLVLGLLVFRALRGGSAASWNWRWSFCSLVVIMLCAAIDELLQSLVPTRSASIVDVGIDIAGGILAQFVIAIVYRFRKK